VKVVHAVPNIEIRVDVNDVTGFRSVHNTMQREAADLVSDLLSGFVREA
jgi:hypothetical protein